RPRIRALKCWKNHLASINCAHSYKTRSGPVSLINFFFDLIDLELSVPQMRIGTAIAAAFNLTGFLLLISSYHPGETPLLAPLLSMSVGVAILVCLGLLKDSLSRAGISVLYIINTLSVIAALAVLNAHFAHNVEHWVPFRPSQIGCLFTAMI